jgi:hypothetical protein
MSYHGKDGKFSSAASAHTVSKGGERFKVVRQHRRIGPSKKAKSARQTAEDAIRRTTLARQKAALLGALSGPGWVNLHEALEAVGK